MPGPPGLSPGVECRLVNTCCCWMNRTGGFHGAAGGQVFDAPDCRLAPKYQADKEFNKPYNGAASGFFPGTLTFSSALYRSTKRRFQRRLSKRQVKCNDVRFHEINSTDNVFHLMCGDRSGRRRLDWHYYRPRSTIGILDERVRPRTHPLDNE